MQLMLEVMQLALMQLCWQRVWSSLLQALTLTLRW
jgi:hypothetical protein